MPRAKKHAGAVGLMVKPEKKCYDFKARNRKGFLLRIKAHIIDNGEAAGGKRYETRYVEQLNQTTLHSEYAFVMPSEDRVLSAFSTFIHRANV